MKALMVLDREYPPDLRVENEVEALLQAGHEVHLACYTRQGRTLVERSGGVTIQRKPISDFIYRSSAAALTLPFYFRFWKKFLNEILQQQPFDLVHVHDLPLVGPCKALKRQYHFKLIADLHENWPAFVKISKHTNTLAGKLLSPVFLWRRYEKRVLRHTDAVIVVVHEAKERIVNLGISPDLIWIVSNTLNTTKIESPVEKLDHKEIILFYAGGINRHRGLQNVIKILQHVKNRNLRFWILGDGSYKDHLFRLVSKYGLEKVVLFKGYQPFRKMMSMLQESDFAIIPHLKNEHTDSTLPHKLFQYMYMQKPVIASNCIPIEYILKETGAGIVYSPDYPDQLTSILNHIETFDKAKMGLQGKKWVEQKYNWEQDSDVLTQVYESLKNDMA